MANYAVNYIKADPSGNTTVFVLTPLPREVYPAVAARLMDERVLRAEQVGFIEKTGSGSRMRMMGGEFCGNASRSYAAWLVMAGDDVFNPGGIRPLPPGERKRLRVEVSGSEKPLEVLVEDIGSPRGCFAEIDMPLPLSIMHGDDPALGDYSLVAFEGIIHGVLWHRHADEALLDVFRRLLRARNFDDANCGLMFVEKEEPLVIRPLVYVGEMGSLVWESSCGSGSIAVLCALMDKTSQSYRRLAVSQPGGILEVSGEYTSRGIERVRLAGEVYYTAAGTADVEV